MTREHWRAGFERGVRDPLIAPEEAAAYAYSPTERSTIEALRRKAFVGTAEKVSGRLAELAQRLALDELVVVTWTYDPAPRHRSSNRSPGRSGSSRHRTAQRRC
jgi:alkanesulfonate monooxygenase SsuD/methylene tetrahydromethanopterin reductase-like flavin-dependent oxidoreductase (luciferase family)